MEVPEDLATAAGREELAIPSQLTMRTLGLVGVGALVLAGVVMCIPTTSTRPAERVTAREALLERPVPTPSGRIRDVFVDVTESSSEPAADWPERTLWELHREIGRRDGFASDVAGHFPYFLCDTRCTSGPEAPALWDGSHAECMEACALDRYHQQPNLATAFDVLVVAQELGNPDLYAQVVTAYPDVWSFRRTYVASFGARGVLTLWWGDTMRARAPDLQRELFAWGHEHQGPVGVLSMAVSGATACEFVGGRAVCP